MENVMKQWSIAFFGSQQNSAQLLELLVKDKRFKVLVVVTQPDRPVGRKKTETSTPVSVVAEKYSLNILKPERSQTKKNLFNKPEELYQQLKKYDLDLILTYEYGQLLTAKILALGKMGGVNIHFSLLPSYRGAAPLPWQIICKEKETGISFTKMALEFDMGDLLYQEVQEIKSDDTTVKLHRRLSESVLNITPGILMDYLGGKLKKPKAGNYPKSYCHRMTRKDGYMSYAEFEQAIEGNNKIASKLDRMLRAFNPWPGVYTKIKDKRFKILRGRLSGNKFIPEIVQQEGKVPQSWKSHLSKDCP